MDARKVIVLTWGDPALVILIIEQEVSRDRSIRDAPFLIGEAKGEGSNVLEGEKVKLFEREM